MSLMLRCWFVGRDRIFIFGVRTSDSLPLFMPLSNRSAVFFILIRIFLPSIAVFSFATPTFSCADSQLRFAPLFLCAGFFRTGQP